MSARVEEARAVLAQLDARRAELEEEHAAVDARREAKRTALARATAARLETTALKAEVAGLSEELGALAAALPLVDRERADATAELDRAERDAAKDAHRLALEAATREIDEFVQIMTLMLQLGFLPRWVRVAAAIRTSVDAEQAERARTGSAPASAMPTVLRYWWKTYRGTYDVADTLARTAVEHFGLSLNNLAVGALAGLSWEQYERVLPIVWPEVRTALALEETAAEDVVEPAA